MPNNNDDRKLLLYVSISIILHLLILYFLPIGFLHGSAQSESDLNDYGYVQLVDYQPAPVEEETAEEEAELTEDPDEEELEEIEEEVEEPEPEVIEEPEPEPEIVEEPEPTPEPEPEAEVEETEEEVMASEESESEVEVVQEEETSESEVVEENTDSAAEEEISAEEENVETETETVEEDNVENNEGETAEQEEETAPPPPPPTSGDLIGLIEPPTFPKDLVGSRSEGTVSLMVEISPGGNVENIEIIESSGYDSMDRVAQLTLEHGWEFKEYQQAYKIPVSVKYYIDQSDNSQVEVDIGQVDFISGGE